MLFWVILLKKTGASFFEAAIISQLNTLLIIKKHYFCNNFTTYNQNIKMIPKTKVTAAEIYDLLLNDFNIKDQIGSVEIILGGISAKYHGKDAIGDLLQEWLGEWLRQKNFYFRQPLNTQEFPDFLLTESLNSGFLELKTFNADASPAFDIANFDSYCTSLLRIPERIDADYLIISYKMIDAQLSIDNIWLKKVWEMTSPSGQDPIKLQVKRNQIYNLRPCTWYSNRLQYQPFKNKIAFLYAISQTHSMYPQCDKYKEGWLENIKAKYLVNTRIKLQLLHFQPQSTPVLLSPKLPKSFQKWLL